jgi:DNA-binding GntR family transcriptional regulator
MPLSIAEKLKQQLEQEILTFNLKPGERLDETKLAERYGTSRTPVREALRLLAAEGLVCIRAHRGAIVAGLSIAELIDMYDMLAILEGACTRLTTSRACAEEIEKILETHEQCRISCNNGDHEAYCLANAKFHDSIHRASHNNLLFKQTIATRNRLGTYQHFQLRRSNSLHESFQQHDAIVNAIKKGDASEAERLMREHIVAQGAQITSLIARLPPQYFAELKNEESSKPASTSSDKAFPPAALSFE